MKKVRFAKYALLSEIKSHRNMSKHDISNIWYRMDDLRMFKKKEGIKNNSDNDPQTSKKEI